MARTPLERRSDSLRAHPRPRLGISACLLGESVRFDGGHKRDPFLTETLGRFVDWVPVCPEVEAGFGTPREPMRLVSEDGRLRLQTVTGGADWTDLMARFASDRVDRLSHDDLCGYVLKKDSPSCGKEGVKVFHSDTAPTRGGRGLFAAALLARYPLLPIEEEGRLLNPRLRDNFVERVFAYRRLRRLFWQGWTVGQLVRFHAAHKLTLMAHHVDAYRRLGQLVASAAGLPKPEVEARYSREFMSALALVASRRGHVNVLLHMSGYLRHVVEGASKAELRAAIEHYRRGLVPLAVPIGLIRRHAERYGVSYLADQSYLDPWPDELSQAIEEMGP
jgi:uncharacterized protein YbgA (DUF1722 family)/uncharacterized protein YbbK (DUF523 family)